ncbi:nuclear factor, erythroid 2 S homeolog [Xenopus laevis]|uniref:LOC495834 protein n=1 Tax=Xenopus laevis TaxID=8355 RepID=Q5RJW8_XENLA|nr:nuclear factor, erythroid 2 S homeolog [Xenopus laevis]AAH86473.1 LOC495834 protein [Xenopus laevis]
MDVAWQEILSIAELQGLDAQNNSPYDAIGCGTSAMPSSDYGPCQYTQGVAQSVNHNIQVYDQIYMDANTSQDQHVYTLPLASACGPTAYTGMLISSSINQMGASGHYPPKNLPLNGLFTASTMPNVSVSSTNSVRQLCKGQDEFESDSGLSLNFSDGESIELENIESQRLQVEYMEMLPALVGQDQFGIVQSLMHNITDAHQYSALQSEELVCNRDERQAAAMNIPFPTERIVNLPVEDFNEILSNYTLTDTQMALVRDIRRRGKNKVAAQNCRKRKMENIASLEREIGQLQTEREGLKREQEEAGRVMGDLKRKLEGLQREVLSVLSEKGSHHYHLEDFMSN